MRAAYLYQIVNLLVSILTVPLLLRFLDIPQYVLWSVFTTFGAITVQLQYAIQYVSVRRIARQHIAGDPTQLRDSLHRTKIAYLKLTAILAGPILLIGFAYLNLFAKPKLGIAGNYEWTVFILAYVVTYYFATNNAILLGMMRVSTNNNINSVTRSLSFFGIILLLRNGFGIMGMCLSFLVAAIVGAVINTVAARRTLRKWRSDLVAFGGSSIPAREPFSNIRLFTFYSLCAFMLYNGSMLVATSLFPNGLVAAYSLGLQTNTMLTAFALIPLQVWLNQFVAATASGNRDRMLGELAISIVVSNLVFLVGAAGLVIFGGVLLDFLHSRVQLPNLPALVLISAAFWVELNIALLVNFLVTIGNYGFVRIYVATSIPAMLLGMVTAKLSSQIIGGLVLVPLLLQAGICFPIILQKTCRELDVSPVALLRRMASVRSLD